MDTLDDIPSKDESRNSRHRVSSIAIPVVVVTFFIFLVLYFNSLGLYPIPEFTSFPFRGTP